MKKLILTLVIVFLANFTSANELKANPYEELPVIEEHMGLDNVFVESSFLEEVQIDCGNYATEWAIVASLSGLDFWSEWYWAFGQCAGLGSSGGPYEMSNN